MKQTVNLICTLCQKPFNRSLKNANVFLKRRNINAFCSKECQGEFKTKQLTQTVECAQCKTEIVKQLSRFKKSKSGLSFCSQSCSAKYNNTHKKYGIRRSKLEMFLEQSIKEQFPNLTVISNGKDVIGSELDFYFPDLRFAIELNGPLHYEPIYGNKKFDQITNNDKQKIINCYNNGIELCVIDVSSIGYLTQKIKEKYRKLVIDLIFSILGRLQITSD